MTVQTIERIGVARVFARGFTGFGAGFIGTIALGVILMLTWGIVGEVLSPENAQNLKNEFGVSLNKTPSTHPLFLGVVVIAVFLATLIANLSNAMLNGALEAKYTHKSTNIIQVFLGNMVLLLIFIPIYLATNALHGSDGVGITALTHTALSGIFGFLVLEILNTPRKYLLLSLYSVILGIGIYLFTITLFGMGNPSVIAFLTLPILLGSLGTSSAITQMFYIWVRETYNNDFLDAEKRFGGDYSNADEDRNKVRDANL